MSSLTDDQIAWILSFPQELSFAKIGQIVGCHPSTAHSIWDGRYRRKQIAEIRQRTYCFNCRHFDVNKGGCQYRFPDVEVHGPAFARDCNLYEMRQPAAAGAEATAR
jgi:hypothetical protein